MRNSTPKHIGEIIHLYLNDRNWNQRIDGYNILQSWKDMVPKSVFLNTKPVKIQNDSIFIKVKNHVWANELKNRKGEIIKLINNKIGEDLIKNIIIKIDTRRFDNYKK